MKYVATVDGKEYEISLEAEGSVLVDGVHYAVDLQSIDGGFHYSLLVGGASHEVFVERCEDICTVVLGGRRLRVRVEDERIRRTRGRGPAALQDLGAAQVISPMPGVVIAVLVQEGQSG
jgi:biotin carboxyl carrier protein